MHRVYRGNYPKPILELFNANRSPDYTARRGPEFFEIPRSRLVALDKTLAFRGPMYYNATINHFSINNINYIDTANSNSTRLECKNVNCFKYAISRYLLEIQGAGDENWVAGNFALHG